VVALPFVKFEILGDIHDLQAIAVGHGIRDLHVLTKLFGRGNWRKMKGFAVVRFANGTIAEAEVHWYEAHGVGRRWLKVKRVIRK
jgi:hypothetical protein